MRVMDAQGILSRAHSGHFFSDPYPCIIIENTIPSELYNNMWWVLNANPGEYCAVGIHGQVIYINKAANTVMAWFSSQPGASSAGNPNFRAKLEASRALAQQLAGR